MASGYNVFRRLQTGENVHVAWRPDFGSAEKLVSELAKHIPAEYGIEPAPDKPLSGMPRQERLK